MFRDVVIVCPGCARIFKNGPFFRFEELSPEDQALYEIHFPNSQKVERLCPSCEGAVPAQKDASLLSSRFAA
ncbi:MAG: hypothetical protein NTW60_01160 [Candidatus Wolfebacteria bacterium]|nr:hypothetical protein [Candidatus Wolfebacteria bacterium]